MFVETETWDLPPSRFICGDPISDLGNTGTGNICSYYLLPDSIAETWTLTCKADTSKFTVVGSVTGATADATVNRIYNNTFINFYIATGVTPFVQGDEFTIEITEDWAPSGDPATDLQQRFLDLFDDAAASIPIAFVAYNQDADVLRITLEDPIGNTGNGTVSNYQNVLETTIAETWTLTCKADTTKFTVVGSVTGATTDAIVDFAYGNGFIGFRIVPGVLAFVQGDSFILEVEQVDVEQEIEDQGYVNFYDEVNTELTELIYTKP